MKITIFGTGGVGLFWGAWLSKFGHDVTCEVIVPTKIAKQMGHEGPVCEQEFRERLKRIISFGHLWFTTVVVFAANVDETVFVSMRPAIRNGELRPSRARRGALHGGLSGFEWGSR